LINGDPVTVTVKLCTIVCTFFLLHPVPLVLWIWVPYLQ